MVVALQIGLVGIISAQDTVAAIYVGMEDGVYLFEEPDGSVLEFEGIDNALVTKFQLKSSKTVDQGFKIVYETSTVTEDDMDYEVFTVLNLIKAKVVRLEEEEEDEDTDW